MNFTKSEIDEIAKDPHSIRHMLVARNVTFRPEDALIVSKALISFNLRTIHFSPVSSDQKPECYLIKVSRTFRFLFLLLLVITPFKIATVFDNSRHTGQVFVELDAVINYVNLCNGRILQAPKIAMDVAIIFLVDMAVLFLCVFSLILCMRALIKAYLLKLVNSAVI